MTIALVHAVIREYGCCKCQRDGLPRWHREGEPLYEAHLHWQSKHGIRERSDPDRFVERGDKDQFVGRI